MQTIDLSNGQLELLEKGIEFSGLSEEGSALLRIF